VDGHIYIGEELQKDIDAATFEYITDYFYKDKNHVYYYDRWRGKEAHFLMVEGYDIPTPMEVMIFNEMGLKVYESNYYQQNGEYFRGYPNVQNVNKSKTLAGGYLS